MKILEIPFREPAKLTFNKLTPEKLPAGSHTLVVVLDEQSLEGKSAHLEWMKSYLKEEMVNDLKKRKSLWIYPDGSEIKRILLVIACDKSEPDKNVVIRGAADNTIQQLKALSIKDSIVAFGEFSAEEVGNYLTQLIIENTEHTKKSPESDKSIERFDIHLKEEIHGKMEEINYWIELGKATILSKNLVNQSPSLATPEWVEEQVHKTFSSCDKIKIATIKGQELEDKGYGCIYAVGKGAVSPPRIITIYYNGNSSSSDIDLALVGKGVTFDSGGLNLKPAGYLECMNLDKSGACSVFAAVYCINALKLPINVVGCLALAENAIGKECYKPGDVLTAFSGKTVEIVNTDAEGRLCLADAMGHVQKFFKPKIMIDIATLTGACMVALGLNVAGMFTDDEKLAETLIKCSSHVGEKLWRFPLWSEYSKKMVGAVADLKNSGGTYSGISASAAFLKEFVEGETKWAHLDIAGPAMKSHSASPLISLGTGFGTKLMVELAKSLISK